MGQFLHGSAKTTHAVRAELQRSKAPTAALGAFGVASAIPAIVAVPLGPWALGALGAGQTAAIAGGLALAALLTLTLLPARISVLQNAGRAMSFPPLRTMAWPTTALTVGAIVVGAAVTFLPLAHPELNPATIMAGLLLQGLGAACARWAAGRPIDRHGSRAALIGATILSILGLLFLAAPGALAVLVGMTISGIAFGVVQSASLNRLLASTAPDQADVVGALWNGAYDVGLGVGGLTLGGLVAAFGYPASFVVVGVALAVLAAAAFLQCESQCRTC